MSRTARREGGRLRILRIVVVGLVLGFLIGSISVASAHNVSDYPSHGWKYSSANRNRIFRTHPTQWPSTFNARTDAAMELGLASGGAPLRNNVVLQRPPAHGPAEQDSIC